MISYDKNAKSARGKLAIVLCDALILGFCAFGAFLTKYAPNIDPQDFSVLLLWLPALVGIYIIVFAIFGMYKVLWRYADSYQMLKQGMAAVVGFGLTFIANLLFDFIKDYRPLSNNFLITYFMFALACIFISRLAIQNFARRSIGNDLFAQTDGRRIMIVGAGEAGAHMAEMIIEARGTMGSVEVIVDDDESKRGFRICDVPVSGSIDDIQALADSRDISDIIIALPTASKDRLNQILDTCLATGCYVRVMDRLKHVEE